MPKPTDQPHDRRPAESDYPSSGELTPLPDSLRTGVQDVGQIGTRSSRPAEDSDESRPRGARRGDVIGERYVVDGQIGRGGMGRIMRVRHKVLGKAFALKLIKAPIATDRRIREMFYREARLASVLSHDNIVSIVDFGRDRQFGLFMVMELLEGSTLHQKIYDHGRMAPKVACDVIWQIGEALRYIHERAIIHGDIKSENMLLTRTPDRRRVVKLLDFGLARPGAGRTSTRLEGTAEYMAPERINGAPPSAQSDIYALGIVFYELLVGQRPYTGAIEEVLRQHCKGTIAGPSTLIDESIDERADAIIAKATAKDPDDRYQDVSEFLYELRTFMNMLGMDVSRRRSGSTDKAARSRSRALDYRAKGAAEVFEHAPVPLASVAADGKVRVANQAFLEFLGVAGDAGGINLVDSGLKEVYPTLLDDLRETIQGKKTVKRVISLEGGGKHAVRVAVILSPAPNSTVVTTGEAYMALHPLGRDGSR